MSSSLSGKPDRLLILIRAGCVGLPCSARNARRRCPKGRSAPKAACGGCCWPCAMALSST